MLYTKYTFFLNIYLLYCLLIYNKKIIWVLALGVLHATATMLLCILPNEGKITEKN